MYMVKVFSVYFYFVLFRSKFPFNISICVRYINISFFIAKIESLYILKGNYVDSSQLLFIPMLICLCNKMSKVSMYFYDRYELLVP